ncbi:glycosyltransferase [uncultured Cohaesibacter sp.]|uniref:glycosyltransferase family 8 protein n=1 Tax=uncultured Cohaesibacter sp. TaxID=1002546 RepID=UPI0029C8C156|nr:glycosyltransferase [uncultured Cohaesibacter sp.]
MALQSIFHCAEKAAELIDGLDYSDVIDDVISVALSSDFKFHKYACVTIASLLTNYKGSKPLCVYLLIDKELAREDAENFAALQDIHPFEFRPIVVDGTKYQNVRITLGITVATYYRLKLHEVLPSSCNKVIYLDSDLIVLHCLSDLYHIDLGRSIVGGVEDSISKIFVDRFTQHPQVEHFNAGVLLINLRKLRDIQFYRHRKRIYRLSKIHDPAW